MYVGVKVLNLGQSLEIPFMTWI